MKIFKTKETQFDLYLSKWNVMKLTVFSNL